MNGYPRYFLALLWSGLILLIASGLVLSPGMFELRLQWEVPWSLPGGWRSVAAATHGLMAMLLLVIVGALLPLHVRSGLRFARNFASGIVLLTALATLAASGWAIYYTVNEDLSAFASMLHLGTGLAGVVPWCIHVIRGRRLRRARESASVEDAVTFVDDSRRRKSRVA